MTKKCVVCKLEPNPICTLTFHKFPKNDVLKQKWISALQLTKNVNSNTTYVCSNHFHESDFFPTGVNRQRTRLLTDAVPSCNINSPPGHSVHASTNMLVLLEPKQENLEVSNDEVSGSGTVESRENSLSSPTILYSNTDQTEIYVTVPKIHYDDEIPNNLKRELQDTETLPTKRVRLTDGVRTELFSRRDFSSDSSWSRFVEVIQLKQRKQAAVRQKNSRINKKLIGLEDLVKSLQEKNELYAAQCLQAEEQRAEITARQQSSNYMNAPLKCHECYKGFVDNDAFQHHVKKHDPSSGDIECPICKFRFKTRRLLQKHAANHEKKYSCKTCPYVSKTTTQAKQHQKWHNGVTYKCQHCDEVSTKWTSYLSHVRIKHPSEFICDVCGYSFVSKLGLNMHKTMMHKDVAERKPPAVAADAGASQEAEPEAAAAGEAAAFCADCDVQFASAEAWKRHMVTSAKHSGSDTFGTGCRACGSRFASAEELRLHHRAAHARRLPRAYPRRAAAAAAASWPAACDHCSEVVPNAREYWAHFRRAHPDQKYPIHKAYICEICGKGFRGNAFLVYHKRTHSGERAYKCAQCPKAFFNRTNLQMHEKTHSDHRPYPCSVCFKAFKSKGALDRHFRSHTGVKPYECEFCGKAFGQSNSRKLHVRTVHLKQPAPYVSRARRERRRLAAPAPAPAASASAASASAPAAAPAAYAFVVRG